jgi:hypothetical protein
LGHADSALTLRIYGHAMRNEETDLSFAEFGHPKRPYTAPRNETEFEEAVNYLKRLARREGFASELCSPAQRSEASSRTPDPQVRERALLAMRFASEAGSRRRIPT